MHLSRRRTAALVWRMASSENGATHRRVRWLWPAALVLVIWNASGQGEVASAGFAGEDKIAHFFVFGLLATLVVRTGFASGRAWVAVLLVSLYGAVDELHQSLTPGRFMTLSDWVADTLGAAVAVAVYVKWHAYRRWLERPLRRGVRKCQVENRGGIPPNPGVT